MEERIVGRDEAISTNRVRRQGRRDVGESDTVTIVTDMLAEIFGYDKYSEITSEHAIKGTYCDLAIKLEGGNQSIIEVKAVGLGLKDQHVKQAVDYAANQGVEWVVLTNGVTWRVYKVFFVRPIDHELVIGLIFRASISGPNNTSTRSTCSAKKAGPNRF